MEMLGLEYLVRLTVSFSSRNRVIQVAWSSTARASRLGVSTLSICQFSW